MKSLLISVLILFVTGQMALAKNATCDFGAVKFLTDFPTARINGCEEKSGDYHLYISPETKPVNPSPWYGFKVISDKKRTINVYLNYTYAKHRYWPKVSRDGLRWSTLDARKITRYNEDRKVRLKLAVDDKPLWVSAQEIFNNQQYDLWSQHMAGKDFVDRRVLGKSVEGRPIYKLETTGNWQADKPANLLLVGRQHPPEVTGALALLPFVETILSDSRLARRFRDKFRIIIVPNLNPDGVFNGNWRMNANGRDLNRDWGPFTQPETRLMRTELDRFRDEKDGKLYLMLDFHSTYENLIYTQSTEDSPDSARFARDWYGAIKKRLPDIAFKHDPRHNTKLPTSKGYVHKTFGVPAITYEMGDESDRGEIRRLANVAAEEMMKILLGAFEE
ncbi:MAG: peptidase M14 [Alphaproteobacteria bacterium]|nr:MAG: peptidase M14 [Alphaproteobacteria bacterium]